jgi:hypothetical protein
MGGLDMILIDAATKLFKSLIDGLSLKQKANQDLYNNFVVPALANFEAVHQNYLTTLAKYQTMIQETDKPLNDNHPVMKEIANDAIFSANLRARSRALYEYHDDRLFGDLLFQ